MKRLKHQKKFNVQRFTNGKAKTEENHCMTEKEAKKHIKLNYRRYANMLEEFLNTYCIECESEHFRYKAEQILDLMLLSPNKLIDILESRCEKLKAERVK